MEELTGVRPSTWKEWKTHSTHQYQCSCWADGEISHESSWPAITQLFSSVPQARPQSLHHFMLKNRKPVERMSCRQAAQGGNRTPHFLLTWIWLCDVFNGCYGWHHNVHHFIAITLYKYNILLLNGINIISSSLHILHEKKGPTLHFLFIKAKLLKFPSNSFEAVATSHMPNESGIPHKSWNCYRGNE